MAAAISAERFRPIRVLGRGGTSTVELVWDTLREAPVARKRPVVQNLRSVRRLRRELVALEAVDHRSIVRPLGIDIDEYGFFLTMAPLDGVDLYDYCRPDDRFDLDRLLTVLPSVLAGIAHMHARGWVHRDLKPANVIVSPDGQASIVDFGMAGRVGSSGHNYGGTPTHMAPEQIRGAPPSTATDLYVLGVTLFELVAGEPPFDAPVMQLFGKHLHVEAPRLRSRAPTAPDGLVELTARLLRKAPEDRATLDEVSAWTIGLEAPPARPGRPPAERSGIRLKRPS